MKIIVIIEDMEYVYQTPVQFPDTEQMMYGMESIINKLEFPKSEVEDYILGWAEEIKLNRNGKD